MFVCICCYFVLQNFVGGLLTFMHLNSKTHCLSFLLVWIYLSICRSSHNSFFSCLQRPNKMKTMQYIHIWKADELIQKSKESWMLERDRRVLPHLAFWFTVTLQFFFSFIYIFFPFSLPLPLFPWILFRTRRYCSHFFREKKLLIQIRYSKRWSASVRFKDIEKHLSTMKSLEYICVYTTKLNAQCIYNYKEYIQ